MRPHRIRLIANACRGAVLLALAVTDCAAEKDVPVPAAFHPQRAPDPLLEAASSLDRADSRRFVQSAWRASLSGPAGTVSIADDKQLLLLPGKDFDLAVRRVHEGSESGRSDEAYRAIRKDGAFFTRGAGGPFVRWDDAVDEPALAASVLAHEARAILEGLSPCTEVAWTGNSAALRLAKAPCTARLQGLLDGGAAELRELTGEVRVAQGVLLHASLMLRCVVSTASGARDVALTWRLDATEPSSSAKVETPAEVSEGRRERPVRMAEEVLGSLGEPWGPGAVGILRDKPGRKVPAVEGED